MSEPALVATLTFLASVVGAYLSARATNRRTSVDLQGVVDDRVRLVLEQMAARVEALEADIAALKERERQWESLFRVMLPKLDTHEPGLIAQLRERYPDLTL